MGPADQADEADLGGWVLKINGRPGNLPFQAPNPFHFNPFI